MNLYEACQWVDEFRRLEDLYDLPQVVRHKLRETLVDEFESHQRLWLAQTLENMGNPDRPKVSKAEVQIALGEFRHGGDVFETPQKALAVKLFRDRTGLGLREAKEMVEAAMIAYMPPKPEVDSTTKVKLTTAEKIEIERQKRNGTSFDRDSWTNTIITRTGCSYDEAREAVDSFCYTLNW